MFTSCAGYQKNRINETVGTGKITYIRMYEKKLRIIKTILLAGRIWGIFCKSIVYRQGDKIY